MAVAASGMLSVHESCPVCTPDPDVVLVHTPKPDAPLSNNCLTKQDCIDDIEALWRRGNVFDFSLVNPTSSFIEGRIQFKHFDLNRKMFVNGFPTAFKKEAEKRGVIPNPHHLLRVANKT